MKPTVSNAPRLRWDLLALTVAASLLVSIGGPAHRVEGAVAPTIVVAKAGQTAPVTGGLVFQDSFDEPFTDNAGNVTFGALFGDGVAPDRDGVFLRTASGVLQ